jgi:hypothetical protein
MCVCSSSPTTTPSFFCTTGLVERTDAFKKAATEGGITDWKDQYMRMVMRFDTGAEKYRWLNESLFVAEGRLAGGERDRIPHLPGCLNPYCGVLKRKGIPTSSSAG